MQGERSLRVATAVSASSSRRIGRRIRGTKIAAAAALVAAPVALIVLLAWPMLFTDNGFNEDWLHHLWYMWNQSLSLREAHHPSFFLHSANSVFYPIYAFYGGTLYTIVGTVSLLLGDSPTATYILSYLACLGVGYGGWYWLARISSLRGWRALVPGTLFLTSSYYLTLIYARGDLPELVGVSTIPLLVASGISVLRAERLVLGPAAVFTGSAIVFFGAHNLTMLWGSTLLAIATAAAFVAVPEVRRYLRRRAVLRIAVTVGAALLVNAWFLLPAAAYQSHTLISNKFSVWKHLLRSVMDVVSAHRLFTLSRASVFPSTSGFALSLPVLAMVWVAVGLVVCWLGGLRGMWVRLMMLGAGMATLLTVTMTHASLILELPRPYAMLQFSYRLESYVVLAVVGAVLAGMAAVQRAPRNLRLWTWALIPITLVAVVGAIQQVGAAPRGPDRQAAIASPLESNFSRVIPIDYSDGNLPQRVDRVGTPPELVFPANAIHGDRITMVVHWHPGQLVYSNIGAGPEFVHITGAKIVGTDRQRRDVLQIGPSSGGPSDQNASQAGSASSGRWTEVVSVSPTHNLPIILGRLLSLAAAALLIVALVILAIRQARARHA